MVAIIFKYKSVNLIMLYYCTHSKLLSTIGIVIQNSIELIKNVEFGSWVIDDWNKV